MKKIIALLFLFILSVQTVYSQTNIVISPKFCVDMMGGHNVSALGQSGSMDVKTSVTIGLELSPQTTNEFAFGVGTSYLLGREQDASGTGKFYFVPIYLLGRMKLGEEGGSVMPSIVLNAGYNLIFDGDDAYSGPLNTKGGLYIAGGARLEFGEIFFDAMYKSFNGTATMETLEIDVTYTTLSIGIGMMF